MVYFARGFEEQRVGEEQAYRLEHGALQGIDGCDFARGIYYASVREAFDYNSGRKVYDRSEIHMESYARRGEGGGGIGPGATPVAV